MKLPVLSPKITLPVMVLLGVMVMGMRVADMYDAVSSGKLSLHPAFAEDGAKAAPAAKDDATNTAKDAPAPAAAPSPSPVQAADTPAPDVEPKPPVDVVDQSPAEIDVLKQLAGRREELEKRSKDLDTREALMKITEQRVDLKIKEMQTLRTQVQSLLNQASEAQQVQLDNLVKIYETMKPEDAARIFDTLEMPVLMGVVQKMKPAHTALIMAKMSPDKAKEVTTNLTKQDQLPQLK
jgi:flagellar motility protein MotE (MotC chaperone)